MINNKGAIIYRVLIAIALFILPVVTMAQDTGVKSDTLIVYNFYKHATKFQNIRTDSMQFYAEKAVGYAEKHNVVNSTVANSYYLVGFAYYQLSNFPNALTAFENFRKTAEKTKNNKDLFLALNSIANVYIEQGKPDAALSYYLKCLALATGMDDKKNIGLAYNNIAFVYKDEGKYDEAMNYLFKSININEEIDNKLAIGSNYLQLSVIFLRRADYINSEKYAKLSLPIFEALHKFDLVVNSHYMLSAAYEQSHDMVKARAELEKAVITARQTNDPRAIALNNTRLGDLLYEGAIYKEALVSYKEAATLMEKIKLQRSLASAYVAVGKTLGKLGDFTESEKYLKLGLAEAIKNNQAEVITASHRELSVLYHAMKKDSLAVEHLSKHLTLKDSLMSVQTSDKLSELEKKYETEKKQKQIEVLNSETALQASNLKNQNLQLSKSQLEIANQHLALDKSSLQLNNQQLELGKKQSLLNEKQLESKARGQKITLLNNQNTIQQLEINKRNTTIMIIAAVFILVLIMGYQFYSRYKLKQEAVLQAVVIKQQDMATKGIIEAEERERKRIAGELHDGVGQLFTTVKMNMEILMERFLVKQPDADLLAERTMAMVDESCTEVRSIAHQMMPNALIKSGLVSALRDFINKIPSERLKVTMETKGLDNGLESTTETVLYRVIQESVNNVIKHAQATTLDILILGDDKEITVAIEDNGIGFNTDDKSKFAGIGLKNMISRVEYLKGTVDIASSPGKGTLVAIFIPVT
jgi:two-component system NarL family sensor kinase